MEMNKSQYFCVSLSHQAWACLFLITVTKQKMSNVKAISHKKRNNKPQTDANDNSHLYSRGYRSDKPFKQMKEKKITQKL